MSRARSIAVSAVALSIAAVITAGSRAQPEQASAQGDGLIESSRAGQMKSLQCIACHGPSGISQNPTFPHLAGQNATYLVMQLENFRSGERYHELMTPVAQALSDQDIDDLARYFSAIGPLAAASEAASALVADTGAQR